MTKHPQQETLVELTLGELEEPESSRVREHLIDCQTCRDFVQDLLQVPTQPPEGEAVVTTEERTAAWDALANRLGTEASLERSKSIMPHEIRLVASGSSTTPPERSSQPEGSEARVSDLEPRRRSSGWERRLQLAAAALLAFGAGLVVKGWIDFAPAPTTRVAQWTPLEGESVHSRGNEGQSPDEVTCPSESGVFIWDLPLGPVAAHPGTLFRVEITPPEGQVEILRDVSADAYGRILITRERDRSPNGTYRIDVFQQGGSEVLEEFRLSVACD